MSFSNIQNDVEQIKDSTIGVVNSRFDASSSYALSAWNNAQNFINEIAGVSKYVPITQSTIRPISVAGIASTDVTTPSTIPTLDSSLSDPPSDTIVAPTLTEISIPSVDFPTLTATEPTLGTIEEPSVDIGDSPVLEKLNNVDVPNFPNIDLPEVPVLDSLTIPEIGTIEFPTASDEITAVTFPDPATSYSHSDPSYVDTLRTAITAKLESLIADGITLTDIPILSDPTISLTTSTTVDDIIAALETAEEDTWTRGSDRLELELEKGYTEIDSEIASRGFELPAGTQMSMRLEARNKINKELTALGYDVSKGHAENLIEFAKTKVESQSTFAGIISNEKLENAKNILAKETESARLTLEKEKAEADIVNFITERAIALEGMFLDESQQIANRSFEISKYVSQYAIDLYNAKISLYNSEISALNAKNAVVESQIRIELGKIEKFKADLQRVSLASEVQNHYINIYKEKLNAIDIIIRSHKASVEAALLRTQIEEQKIEEYKAKIQAYVANADVKAKEFDFYTSKVQAEGFKVQNYAELIKAYGLSIDAKKAEQDVYISRSDAQIRYDSLLVEKFRSDIDKYKAEIQSVTDANKALIAKYESDVTKYGVEYDAEVKQLLAKIDYYKAQVEAKSIDSELSIKNADVNMQAAIESNKINVEAMKSSATVSSQLAASAWASVNVSATLSQTGQAGETVSFSSNTNRNSNDSVSTTSNHVYVHPAS